MLANVVTNKELEFNRGMFVTRCCSCKRYKNDDGDWARIIELPPNAIFSDGLCLPCIRLLYPGEMAERIIERLREQGVVDGATT